MKSTIVSLLGATLATALTCQADPVTGWVTAVGDALFSGGSEATSSPSVTDLPQDTIAANFPTVNLQDGDSLTLTGSVLFTGTANSNQFRFGLFDGDNPVTAGDGSGYVGFNADAPNNGTGNLKFGDGTATNPFSSSAGTDITSMSNPGGAAPGNIAIDFILTITRDGDNLDLEASVSNTAGGGSWSSTSGVVQDYSTTQYTFDRVAFLMGSGVGGTTAEYSNIDVTLGDFSPPPPFEARLVEVDMAGGEVTIEWDSLDNGTATYDIYASDVLTGDPQADWTEVDTIVPATGTITSYTETQVGSGSGSETLPSTMPARRFYVIYEYP